MARGWIVEITYCEAGAEFKQRFDVAISDPDEALAAVVRGIAQAGDFKAAARVVEELFDATFFGLGLSPGDILPRLRYRR